MITMYRSILLSVFLSFIANLSICEDELNLDETVITPTRFPDDDPTSKEALADYQKSYLIYRLAHYLCSDTVCVCENVTHKNGINSIVDEDPYRCCSKESTRVCGLQHPKKPRSGTQANNPEFPWSVALFSLKSEQDLQDVNGYFCGGSLIQPGVVLSAAGCLINRQPSEIVAFVGYLDLANSSSKENAIPVSEIVRHEKYHEGNRTNNIALLFLRKQAKLDPSVGTVCLPESNADEPEGVLCLATGWGNYQSHIMQVMEIKLTMRDICEKQMQKWSGNDNWKLNENTLCARAKRDNCAADRGSPLICQMKENSAVYVQYGILSIGSNCGTKPAQYTKTSSMRDWIDRKIMQNKYSTGKCKL